MQRTLITHTAFAVLALALAPAAIGQDFDPENVVIANVYLASETDSDTEVNLLIRNNRLELVSEDSFPIPAGIAALDAEGGYLIGNLTLDEPPDFIILDTDPRTDSIGLMDTKERATYMVYRGKLRKNALGPTSPPLVDHSQHPVWNAYTPPPVALPISYDASDAWNHFDTEHTKNVLFAIVALDRQHWTKQNDASRAQVGDLENFEGGEVRDIRLGFFGTLNFFERGWGYSFIGSTNAFRDQYSPISEDSFRIIDARLDIPLWKHATLSLGKQKEPISMERIMSLINLPMQERSVLGDSFLPSRNVGVQLSGNAFRQRVSWAGGLFNDFLDTEQSIEESTTAVSGRITWAPELFEDDGKLLHLAVGLRRTNGTGGVQYASEPEFNQAPLYVDTGLIEADAVHQLSLETSFRSGPLWISAEHLSTHVDTPADGTLEFTGNYISAAWILTGEMRPYDLNSGTFGAVPVSRSTRVNGPGAWEISARYSNTDLDDGPVSGGKIDILSLGTSWWITPTINTNVNYRFIVNDRDDLTGRSQGLMLRLLMKLN